MATTALTAAVLLSNPSGASPAKFSMDTGDAVNNNSYTGSPTLVLLVRNDHATVAKTVAVKNVAGTTLTAVSLAAAQQVVLGPFDATTYGATVTIVPETTDIKMRVLDATPTRTAKVATQFAKAAVDAVIVAAGTTGNEKRALRRVSHKMTVALRRITGTNPTPHQHP